MRNTRLDSIWFFILNSLYSSTRNNRQLISSEYTKVVQDRLSDPNTAEQMNRLLELFSFFAYLGHLKSDFPNLSAPEYALPYVTHDTQACPLTFSVLHRLFVYLNNPSTDVENFFESHTSGVPFRSLRLASQKINKLLQKNAHAALTTYLNTPESQQALAEHLHRYRDNLLCLQQSNNQYSTPYSEYLFFRRYVFPVFLLGYLMSLFAYDLCYSNILDLDSAQYSQIFLLTGTFILLDRIFTHFSEAHFKNYYPGLCLDKAFLNQKLSLFTHFFKNNPTQEQILETINQKVEALRATEPYIKQVLNVSEEEVLSNQQVFEVTQKKLFFHYQQQHHPHAFAKPSEEKAAAKASIEAIETLYAHCQDSAKTSPKLR